MKRSSEISDRVCEWYLELLASIINMWFLRLKLVALVITRIMDNVSAIRSNVKLSSVMAAVLVILLLLLEIGSVFNRFFRSYIFHFRSILLVLWSA